MGGMLPALVFAVYLLGVVLAANAAMTARTSQGAIAWALLLIAFPYFAIPAYWFLGRNKVQALGEEYESTHEELISLLSDAHDRLEPAETGLGEHVPYHDALSKLAGADFTTGNSLELLIDGEATFASILAGIRDARSYVIVQFFTIEDDELGRELRAALLDRCSAGVAVFLLYDGIGSKGLGGDYLDGLRDAGANIASFKPNQGNDNRFQLNFRNHRKIVVTDGTTGWVGGHNVADDYLGKNPDYSPWRDTHVRIDGPAVLRLQEIAVTDWYWATRQLPELAWKPTAAADPGVPVQVIPSAPTQRFETAGLMYVIALNSASKRIWLTAPYFVPDVSVMKAIELAALRGVDVRILIPGNSDSWLAGHAALYYISRLAHLGIRVFEYEPGFMHQKVALIDDAMSLVGTANFDNRSFRLNFEVTALVYDEDFAARIAAMLQDDLDTASELDVAGLRNGGWWWRLKVSIARLAAPIL
jgi:cardiolipin synthase